MQTQTQSPSRRCWWPLLIALPPLAAVLGGVATLYFAFRHPDRVLEVPAEAQHVTNSVVPPLR